MGGAALEDQLYIDCARCYLAEALYLATSDDQAERVLAKLLCTYLSLDDKEVSPETVIGALRLLKDNSPSWESFKHDFPYYSAMSVRGTHALAQRLMEYKPPFNFLNSNEQVEHLRTTEMERIRDESIEIASLTKQSFNLGSLQQMRDCMRNCGQQTRFRRDRVYLRRTASIAEDSPVI